MKLLTAQQMRQLDHRAIHDYGVPGIVLMENAGRGAAMAIAERYAHVFPGPVLVIAGKGNNGGDGYVIARHLQNWGWQVSTVVLAPRQQISGDAALNLDVLLNSRSAVHFVDEPQRLDAVLTAQPDCAVIVDAIFGNGLNCAVRGHYLEAIHWINRQELPVAAVDLPSGVDATTGQILGAAVKADCSLTFAFAKLGQVSYPAQYYGGELIVIDLGMPAALTVQVSDQLMLLDRKLAQRLLPVRPVDGHKGTFGHVLLIAGSQGKSGAARMAAEAALRSGCGLLTVACPSGVQPQIASGTPEIMTLPLAAAEGCLSLANYEEIASQWETMSVVAIGPGLGTQPETQALVKAIVQHCPKPLVMDADALNAVADCPQLLRERIAPTILTPHPGEMSRLTAKPISQVQEQRLETAREFAHAMQLCLLLKGAHTVLAAADGRVWVNSSGNSGMASAGMGDVLTGMVAAHVAQQNDPFQAMAIAAYLHGLAADHCAEQLGSVGYLASDVLTALPAAWQHLQEDNDA